MSIEPVCRFDPDAHRYYINDRPVPSVTQVLKDLLPGFQATPWHMARGSAVHAYAAMIAKGQMVTVEDADPANKAMMEGYVAAIYRWFNDVMPAVFEVELQVWSERYMYAGTLDLIPSWDGRRVLIDWKSALEPSLPYQCAAYALAYGEHYDAEPQLGAGVELHSDSTYRMSELFDLRRYKQEWLALLTAYNVRRKCGIKHSMEVKDE